MDLKSASKIAVATCVQLQPFTMKLNIAGSIRRKKPEVKDIEIICVPITERSMDMFGNEAGTIRSQGFIKMVNSLGKIVKGNANGKYIQIQITNYELRITNETHQINQLTNEPINLDLFIPDADDYYRQYAIRTGSAEYAKNKIAAGWLKIGWCGSDKGLRRIEDCIEMHGPDGKRKWKCIKKDAQLPPVWQSEEEFFRWIKVIYEKPMHRI